MVVVVKALATEKLHKSKVNILLVLHVPLVKQDSKPTPITAFCIHQVLTHPQGGSDIKFFVHKKSTWQKLKQLDRDEKIQQPCMKYKAREDLRLH